MPHLIMSMNYLSMQCLFLFDDGIEIEINDLRNEIKIIQKFLNQNTFFRRKLSNKNIVYSGATNILKIILQQI